MADENETVTLEMTPEGRLRLYSQLTGRMQKLGYNSSTWTVLHLGFELPPQWPVDENAQPTLAQLVVLAHKLKMRIIIADLNLVPRRESGKSS